jgi:septal ring factor EnvC (AmiA/AmiB activator)
LFLADDFRLKTSFKYNLYKTNEKLDYHFNKQKERLNNVQTQLNSTRNANTKLNETITSLEKQIKELLTHQSELKRGHIEQKNMSNYFRVYT